MKSIAATALSLAMLTPASALAQDAQQVVVTKVGKQASRQGAAENFTGSVRVDPLFTAANPSRTSGSYVTFERGARTAWHTHPVGQTLIVTAGVGRVQGWGGPVQEIRPGDVVRIPPGQKHWHGASPHSSMTHLAIQEHVDGKTVDWQEKVSDAQYGTLPPPAAPAAAQPSRAQALFGDINPKLAELTDNVLFGDVWARQGLSRRDRSLATVSALVAMNRPDQLRSHLALAQQNGVTKDELIEAITHLAFYSGWPNAINAALVAKEVLK
jgi:4-carboxymuconolactone decarboxylase